MTDHITILPERASQPEVVALLVDMYHEEALIYGVDPDGSFPPLDLPAGRGVFLVARAGGQAIGTGAVRPLPMAAAGASSGMAPGAATALAVAGATAEIKRIYVAPPWRNRGVAGRIVAELERLAGGMGYRRLVLETGLYQPAALRLYERAGFRRMTCWLPEDAAEPLSVCFEKEIVRSWT